MAEHPYRILIRSRIRAQRSHPVSFRWDIAGSGLVGLVEFLEVWVVFHNVKLLGGLDLDAILLVFGLSNLAFAAAETVAGHLDAIPTYLRAGTIDVFYLRPLPLLGQLLTNDFRLKRLARMLVGLGVLVVGLVRNDVSWDLRTLALLVLSVGCGIAIYIAVFVCAAGAQFFLINGVETTNAFTYGGAYASSQPASVFPNPLKVLFGFVVPAAFVGYLPTLELLHLPGPQLLPAWLAWWLPVATLWIWLVAGALWRFGIRRYQGAGG